MNIDSLSRCLEAYAHICMSVDGFNAVSDPFFLSPTWMRVVHHINFSQFAIYLNIFHTNIVLMQFDLFWWHRNNIDMVEREIKITPYNCQCTIDRHFRWEKSNCTSLATKKSDSYQSITQKGECKKSMTRKEWNYQRRRLPSNCGYAIEKSWIFLYIAVKSIQFHKSDTKTKFNFNGLRGKFKYTFSYLK